MPTEVSFAQAPRRVSESQTTVVVQRLPQSQSTVDRLFKTLILQQLRVACVRSMVHVRNMVHIRSMVHVRSMSHRSRVGVRVR